VHFLSSSPAFGWHAEPGIHVLRLILSGALDRHPRLKLVSGHWGEFVVGWATQSGMYNRNQRNFIVAEIGAERIIHSEDFPYVVRDNVSDILEQAQLTDDKRDTIAHRNAEKLMRI
jgi:predicted TIM-barrel fold metal-dependent hydrolase